MPQVPFLAGAYQSRSLPLDAQRAVNFFTEIAPAKDAESPALIVGAPGLSLYPGFLGTNNGPIRGYRYVFNILYFVSGDSFYQMTQDATITFLGDGIGGTAPVSISDNGNQIMIVNNAGGFCYGIPGTAAPNAGTYTDVSTYNGFYPCHTVAFVDGYFVFDRSETGQFFLSALYDGTNYNGLDFAANEEIADEAMAVLNSKDVLTFFGKKTIGYWQNTGGNDFPFAPYQGALIFRGTCASLSVCFEDNSPFFLGDDGSFYRLNDYHPVRVSTDAIDATWGSYSTITDAEAFVIVWEGHKFICLSFPTAKASWLYDINTQQWHERKSNDLNGNDYGIWRGTCSVRAFDKVLVGDRFSGTVGVFDYNSFTEYGNPITGIITSPPIHSDRKRIFMSRFEIYMESGVGVNADTDPVVTLDWSDDGGRNFVSPKLPAGFGALGATQTRTRWLRLGSFRTRTLRLTITASVRRNIVGAYADTYEGV